MGWKKVAVAGCFAPVLGGCNILHLAGHNIVNEHHVVHTEHAIDRELRRDAKAAWQEVRAQHPRRMFTADFRDGFMDGYADYLARGGNAQPPAVPPPKYTRHARYYTPEGHCQIRDYFLGFKYGIDVAVASGQRRFLTVPVLLADKQDGPPEFNVQPGGAAHAPTNGGLPAPPPAAKAEPLGPPKALPAPPGGTGDPPLGKPPETPPKTGDTGAKPPGVEAKPMSLPRPLGSGAKPGVPWVSPATNPQPSAGTATPPKVELPRPKPVPADTGSKFGASWPTETGTKIDPEVRLPAPNPPLPFPTAPVLTVPVPKSVPDSTNPVRPTPPPIPKTHDRPGTLQPANFTVPLPEPPSEVPTLPHHVPTPSILDELPVVPANHAVPAPLPANHAVPVPIPQ